MFLDKARMVQIIGFALVIIFVFSMIAGGVLYANNGDSSGNTTQPLPQSTDSAFNYTISFNGTLTKDLSSIRFGGMTSELNIAKIDSQVLKVDGVSKVTSTFNKTSFDANSWIYLAEITLKKNADPKIVTQSISDLNVFDKSQGTQGMKNIVITFPKYVIIHNVDLNIDRNFEMPKTILSALANINSQVGDELTVGGQMTAQGKEILSIELVEQENLTQAQRINDALQALQDQNVQIGATPPATDTNIPVDINTLWFIKLRKK